MVIVTRSELRKIKTIERKIQQEFLEKKIPTGIEICEIQLYHLASKIRDTEINPSIEDYLPAIYDVLQGLERDEIIKKMVSVEFSRFYNYYSKTRDLSAQSSATSADFTGDAAGEGTVRYFINIGERDGFAWMSLKDFLRKTLGLDRDDIYRVDTKDSFSFFNTDANLTPLVLETFKDVQMDGRVVNVEVSKNPGRGGRKRKKERHRSNKKDHTTSSRKRKSGGGKSRKPRNSGFF